MSQNKNVTILRSCRICLNNLGQGVLLDDGDWLEKYNYCFGLSILPEEEARKLCAACVNQMNCYFHFKKKAHKSDDLWKSLVTVNLNCANVFESNKYEEGNVIKFKEEIIENLDSNDNNGADVTDSDHDDVYYTNHLIDAIKKEVSEDETELQCRHFKNDNVFSCHNDGKVDLALPDNKLSYRDKLQSKKRRGHKKNTFLKRKQETDDKIIKSFYCGLCDTMLYDIDNLKLHLKEHASENDLSCKLCNYFGRDFADMVNHRLTHLKPENYRHLSCPLCNRIFRNSLVLQFHYRSIHLNKLGGFCTVCNKQFRSYKSWRNHERLHKTDKYQCDHCDRKFLFRNNIVDHMKIHMSRNGFICEICGRGFKRNSHLKLHMESRHVNNPSKCDHCNKIFKNPKSLAAHTRILNMEKPFQCDICSKRYALPSLLQSHMIWHKTDRPFACTHCGLAYKAKSQLKVHVRKHTGEMPYKCNQCSKCFPSSNQLKVHSSVHTGVRLHKCSECPRSFHEKKLLLAHNNKSHKS